MALHTRLHLNRGERIIWRRRMTLRSLWLFWLLGAATLWLYGIGLLFIVYAAVKWIRVRYFVTTRRVIRAEDHYAFLLRVDVADVPLHALIGMDVIRGLVGEVLSYADVTIRSDDGAITLPGLRDPDGLREVLRPYLASS